LRLSSSRYAVTGASKNWLTSSRPLMPKTSRAICGRMRFFQRCATKKLRLSDQAASEMSSLVGRPAAPAAPVRAAAAPAEAPMNSRRDIFIASPSKPRASGGLERYAALLDAVRGRKRRACGTRQFDVLALAHVEGPPETIVW